MLASDTLICRCCGRQMYHGEDYEYQEAIIISFQAGYGSIFGDENLVEAVICQHCLKDRLGDSLKITDPDSDDEINPLPPRSAFQPSQLEFPYRRPNQEKLTMEFVQLNSEEQATLFPARTLAGTMRKLRVMRRLRLRRRLR